MSNEQLYYERHNPFTHFSEDEIQPVIAMLTDDILLRDMQDFAAEEDYEMAIIYRNELIRRGRLK